MRAVISSLLVLALAACGGEQAQQAQRNEPQIVVRSAEQDRLHQLSDMDRDIGLKRAIIESGLRCKRVTKSGYVQEHNKLSMWMASCDDDRDWAIFVGADGSAQVRPCVDMARLGLPECKIAADPSGRTARAAAKG
jgi:hypothetical protein